MCSWNIKGAGVSLRVIPVGPPEYCHVFISHETIITLSYSYFNLPTILRSPILAERASFVLGRLLYNRPVSGHPIQEEEAARERTVPS